MLNDNKLHSKPILEKEIRQLFVKKTNAFAVMATNVIVTYLLMDAYLHLRKLSSEKKYRRPLQNT